MGLEKGGGTDSALAAFILADQPTNATSALPDRHHHPTGLSYALTGTYLWIFFGESLHVDGHKIAMALRAAYLTMHRKADASLHAMGITANQFVVLSALQQDDGISQRTLVERVTSDPNTIRPLLSALEEKGLVVRLPNATDRRVWDIKLTRKGRSTLKKASEKTEQFRTSLLSPLTISDYTKLLDMLQRITESVQQHTSVKAGPVTKKKRVIAGRKKAAARNGSR